MACIQKATLGYGAKCFKDGFHWGAFYGFVSGMFIGWLLGIFTNWGV